MRLAGDINKRDGYQKDAGGSGDGSNLNSRAFLATLRIDLSDDISNVTVYDNYWKHTNGDGYVSIGSAGPGATYHFIPGFNCGVSAACDVDLANAEQKARGFRNIISRSEEHTSELQSLMRISYAVFCLKKKTKVKHIKHIDERRTQQTHISKSTSN